MTAYHNPALREEPRGRSIKVSPLTGQESLLGWLESTGRFRSVENDDEEKILEDLDDILNAELYMLKDDEEQEDLE